MREFKLLNLSIFYEEDNELKLVRQDIIARRTIFGNYKEIVTGIKLRTWNLNEEIFLNYYKRTSNELRHPVDIFGDLDAPLWATMAKKNPPIDMKFSEDLAHDYYSELIKKYGVAFVLNYRNNDFRNLRIVSIPVASSYREDFYSTKFYELIDMYNRTSKRYYKQDKKTIKERVRSEF